MLVERSLQDKVLVVRLQQFCRMIERIALLQEAEKVHVKMFSPTEVLPVQ